MGPRTVSSWWLSWQTCSVLTLWPSLSESVVPPLPKDAREPRSRFSRLSSSEAASSKSLLERWLVVYLELLLLLCCCGTEIEGREALTLEVPKYVSWISWRILFTQRCLISRLFAFRMTYQAHDLVNNCYWEKKNAIYGLCYIIALTLDSEAGVRPDQTANLHSSPSTCSVMPMSLVCKPSVRTAIVLVQSSLPSSSSYTGIWLSHSSLSLPWRRRGRARTGTFSSLGSAWSASWGPRRGKCPGGWRRPVDQYLHHSHLAGTDGVRHLPGKVKRD